MTAPDDKIMSRVSVDPHTGCWVWLGARQTNGYGVIRIDHAVYLVHRVMYALTRRDPSGMDVHHECGCRLCCNPHHLALVEPKPHRIGHLPKAVKL